jgi:hypothetical protein
MIFLIRIFSSRQGTNNQIERLSSERAEGQCDKRITLLSEKWSVIDSRLEE